jgi:7-carboxy-7-deazaguanine synthase
MVVDSLRITEIFLSVQGEAASVGYPTVFVRLTGCPLRCHYCDSEYAFYGGDKYQIDNIVAQVKDYRVQHVCVTGGEPLAQPGCLQLMSDLCDLGLQVSLETSGAMPIDDVDKRVSIVMDLKTPASGEVARNRYENIGQLAPKDQLKFIICDRQDYEWAIFKLNEYDLVKKVGHVFFSPSYEQLTPVTLAEWIIEDRLPVRLQTQLHKALWGDKPGV